MFFQIAIDGPVAAGKGTISRKVADTLGFLYVDTGATYRAATLVALQNNCNFGLLEQGDVDEVSKLVNILKQRQIEMHRPNQDQQDGRLVTLLLDGKDVSWEIRQESISSKVPIIAKIALLRQVMVQKQQEIAARTDVVMEGRDITYRVLPGAQLKIYLDADPEIRARRRCEQLAKQGLAFDPVKVAQDLRSRDEMDMGRSTDPLKRIPEAWYLDCSNMDIIQTADLIVNRVQKLRE